jgi:hypothetical protein
MTLTPVLTLAPLASDALRAPAGVPGRLSFLPVSLLVVDSRYQRPIREKGLAMIRRIAEGFDWRRFTPLVVAPVDGSDTYAIVDGQHRAAAARMRGDIRELPCWIIEGDLKQQARAFMAINSGGNVPGLAGWHAALAAGEPDALAVFQVCQEAGVQIARYPAAARHRKPNETLAPDAVRRKLAALGAGPVVRALASLRRAGSLRGDSMLSRELIYAASEICAAHPGLPAGALDAALATKSAAEWGYKSTQMRHDLRINGPEACSRLIAAALNDVSRT